MKKLVYCLFVLLVALATLLSCTFRLSGISILLILLFVAEWRNYAWKTSAETMADTKESIRELENKYRAQAPMVRIYYHTGETVEMNNLENDFKVGEDMKVYIKDSKHNKWIWQQDVVGLEFFLHEFDPVVP